MPALPGFAPAQDQKVLRVEPFEISAVRLRLR